jgi:hypothetical protein
MELLIRTSKTFSLPIASGNRDSRHAETLALQALAWVVGEPARADRLLALTGLGPADLRAGLGERRVQAAILEFLVAHEPDLLAAADALEISPDALVAAHRELTE